MREKGREDFAALPVEMPRLLSIVKLTVELTLMLFMEWNLTILHIGSIFIAVNIFLMVILVLLLTFIFVLHKCTF